MFNLKPRFFSLHQKIGVSIIQTFTNIIRICTFCLTEEVPNVQRISIFRRALRSKNKMPLFYEYSRLSVCLWPSVTEDNVRRVLSKLQEFHSKWEYCENQLVTSVLYFGEKMNSFAWARSVFCYDLNGICYWNSACNVPEQVWGTWRLRCHKNFPLLVNSACLLGFGIAYGNLGNSGNVTHALLAGVND